MKSVLKIDSKTAEQLQKWMDCEDINLHQEGICRYESLYSEKVIFENGYYAEVNVKSSEDDVALYFTLFNDNKVAVFDSDADDTLIKEHYLLDEKNREYIVEIIIEN